MSRKDMSVISNWAEFDVPCLLIRPANERLKIKSKIMKKY